MKRKHKNLVSMIVLLAILILVVGGLYYLGILRYQTHFFRGTTINGVDVGDMTVDDAKYAIQDKIRDYTLTVKERNSITETITGDELYMQYVDDGSVEELMNGQNSVLWILHLAGGGDSYTADIGYTYDVATIDTIMDSMDAFTSPNITAPVDAHIEDTGYQFIVADSSQGNTLKRAETKQALIAAVEAGQTEINFEDLDLYQKAEVSSDDGTLAEKVASLNQMLLSNITYDFVDRQYSIGSETVHGFITQDSDGDYNLDVGKVREWVDQMAAETDTFGLEHEFKTTTGETITLAAGGDYGWATNVDATTTALMDAIAVASQEELEPVYTFTAMDRSTNDIGDTYVEVCIEQQRMWCYKDGTLIADTPVVTGNHAAGTDTPSGSVWAVDAKMADTTFPAAGNVHVDYWLPFNDQVGIHDSSWRENYGENIWLTGGSHGCVNTPNEAAGKIYEAINIGAPVIVYYSTTEVVGPAPTAALSAG